MKKIIMILFLCTLTLVTQGCSKDTRESIEEVGNDMERDIEDAAD